MTRHIKKTTQAKKDESLWPHGQKFYPKIDRYIAKESDAEVQFKRVLNSIGVGLIYTGEVKVLQ